MTTLMFYKRPVALDRAIHRDLRIKLQANGFSFAAATNCLPLAAVEFAHACQEYPIVFVTDGSDGGIPVALTGLRDSENLFVTAHRQWDGAYVPAFVRRYPFVLQGDENSSEFGVLIDAAADEFGAGDGERLFSEGGADTPMLTEMLEFLHQYRLHTHQTGMFVKQLRRLDLLIPRVINGVTQAGAPFAMDGFSVVDEQRLHALNDAHLLALARDGHLACIHAHLISLSNIQKLLARLERAAPSE
jgi:hypothetical protein